VVAGHQRVHSPSRPPAVPPACTPEKISRFVDMVHHTPPTTSCAIDATQHIASRHITSASRHIAGAVYKQQDNNPPEALVTMSAATSMADAAASAAISAANVAISSSLAAFNATIASEQCVLSLGVQCAMFQ